MIHDKPSPLAGTTVKLKKTATHPQVGNFGGATIEIEDWQDRVFGKSWMVCDGNPACLVYAMRTGLSKIPIPTDNEVLYGKIGGLGHIVHITEIEGH